jgi:hypothetical protein
MPRIFVSYRREDSPAMAGWVHQNLSERYPDSVFRDIDSINPAANFRAAIAQALRHTDVVVAVVGPKWRGEGEPARISGEKDWIRLEIEIALQLGIPIIPVLVEHANMPHAAELPETLRDFCLINGLRIDPGPNFAAQLAKLFATIDHIAPAAAAAKESTFALAALPWKPIQNPRQARTLTVIGAVSFAIVALLTAISTMLLSEVIFVVAVIVYACVAIGTYFNFRIAACLGLAFLVFNVLSAVVDSLAMAIWLVLWLPLCLGAFAGVRGTFATARLANRAKNEFAPTPRSPAPL